MRRSSGHDDRQVPAASAANSIRLDKSPPFVTLLQRRDGGSYQIDAPRIDSGRHHLECTVFNKVGLANLSFLFLAQLRLNPS